jgi:hypothetical protein
MSKDEGIIEAFGLTTRVWRFNFKKNYYACSECCNGDRCDCTAEETPYHGRRAQCPHCKGTGGINAEDVTRVIKYTKEQEEALWDEHNKHIIEIDNEYGKLQF